MSTIDKDSDIYKEGSGGLDPENLPDDPNLMLSTGNYRTSGNVEKGWLQVPIAYSDSTRYWFLNLKKEYRNADGVRPPLWFVANSSYQLKTISLELDIVAFYNNANHQDRKRYLLLNVDKFANSDSGKYFRLKKVTGINTWDIEFVDLPTPDSELFEVYIDEDDPTNNRNVVYNDILNAVNSGKYVYLKVKDNTGDYVFYSLNYTFSNAVEFIHTTAGGTAFGFHSYLLLDDDTYTHWSDYVYRTNAYIDESVSPPTTLHLLFNDLKYKFNKGSNEDCNIVYTKSNGDKYKLPAVKLTATEIMFSIYDPDTARNLSIVVNDQNQYTVIT